MNRTLRDLEETLDPARFVRVHKQAIVNLEKLLELEPIVKGGAAVRLASGEVVSVSRRYARRSATNWAGNHERPTVVMWIWLAWSHPQACAATPLRFRI